MLREFVEMLETANNRYDINQMKIDAYTENVIGQFGIDLKRAELKVLQESGTNEDLIYLREEAEDGALAKAKKAIDKIIDNFKNFVHEIQLKIMVLIQKKETKETIDQVEKKIRFNPFLAKKKVDVVNTKEQLSAVAWANAQLQKLLSKIRGGKEVSPDEVTEVADEFDKKMSKAGAVSNAVKMTLADAVKKLKEVGNKMVDSIESAKKTTSNLIEDAKGMSEKLFASVTGAINRIASAASSFGKAAVNAIVNAWKELIATIKSACTGIKEKLSGSNDDDNNVTESYDDHEFDELDGLLESVSDVLGESFDDDIDDDVFTEGANKEMLASVKLLKVSCTKNIRAAYKAYKKGDIDGAKKKLAEAKEGFAKAHDQYRSILTKNSLGEAILGSMLRGWVDFIHMLVGTLVSLPLGGIGGVFVGWYKGIKNTYDDVSQLVIDVKNGEFSLSWFNGMRNKAETAFRDTAKSIDKLSAILKVEDKSEDDVKDMDTSIEESADDGYEFMNYNDDVFTEGANKEMLASVKLLKTTCVKSVRRAFVAYKKGNIKEAKDQLAQAKKDFAEAHDKYRSILTDGSLGETILGSLLVAWVDCISAILAALISLPVGGLAGAIVTWYNEVKELYENITSWVNDIKNDNFTVQSFNAARNRAESAFRDTAKAIDKLDTLINNQQSAAVKKESVDSEFDLDAELDDLLSLDF